MISLHSLGDLIQFPAFKGHLQVMTPVYVSPMNSNYYPHFIDISNLTCPKLNYWPNYSFSPPNLFLRYSFHLLNYPESEKFSSPLSASTLCLIPSNWSLRFHLDLLQRLKSDLVIPLFPNTPMASHFTQGKSQSPHDAYDDAFAPWVPCYLSGFICHHSPPNTPFGGEWWQMKPDR